MLDDFQDFLPKIRKHLLPRLVEKLGIQPGAIPESEAVFVVFQDNRIFNHQILRLIYTTYDVRRDEDVIHVDTPQQNVMLINRDYNKLTWETEDPYLYGKVIGVFHANVRLCITLPDGTRDRSWHRLDLAWVHWYTRKPPRHDFELDRLTLLPLEQQSALGFIDPGDILRAVHVIPRFASGKGAPNVPSRVVHDSESWREYYINR